MIPAPCGTNAAHIRHRRHGEPIDDACRDACRAYEAARRHRRREAVRAAARAREAVRAMAAARRREARELIPMGALAATEVAHPFVPDGHTGSMCLSCFGWYPDPRHVTRPALAREQMRS